MRLGKKYKKSLGKLVLGPSIIFLASLFLLSGCASGPSAASIPSVFKHERVINYPESRTAIIKTVDGEYTATIGRCVGGRKSEPGHIIYVSDHFKSTQKTHYLVDINSHEAHLVPGRYVCDLHCRKDGKSGSPVMVLNLRAGTTTKLQCQPLAEIKPGEGKIKIYHLGLEKTESGYFSRQANMVSEGKLRFIISDYK